MVTYDYLLRQVMPVVVPFPSVVPLAAGVLRAQHRQLRGLPLGAHTDQSPVNTQFTQYAAHSQIRSELS
jgi:hypothetical protein